WGLRSSKQKLNFNHHLAFELCRQISPVVPLAISNSHSGVDDHRNMGFRFRRYEVVPNGIDTHAFAHDPCGGRAQRAVWNVGQDIRLVGLPGRIAAKKGHEIFFRAAAELSTRYPDIRFVCIGDGPTTLRRDLEHIAAELGIGDKVIWAGQHDDMRKAYSALDVICCPSTYGEGFPNVLAEAMACAVPCVASEVGDSASIVGDTGVIVPPGDPEALAAGIDKQLKSHKQEVGTKARQQIVREFSIQTLAERTEAELTSVVTAAGTEQ
ncbi:MAG: glycosyltransferase, partial [Pseudomonadota bacterium]